MAIWPKLPARNDMTMFDTELVFDSLSRWWTAAPADALVIVGGGRWARIWADVVRFAGMSRSPPIFVSASLFNMLPAERYCSVRMFGRYAVHRDFASLPQLPPITRAIIANSPVHRLRSATTIAERGWPMLIEKPVAYHASDIADIIALAGSRCPVFPGHTFFFATYLHEFRRAFQQQIAAASSISLSWCDPIGEYRDGTPKTTDHSIPLLMDVWPHIDAILRLVFLASPRILSVAIEDGGLALRVHAKIGERDCCIHLARNYLRRKRTLTLSEGSTATNLDFSEREPASVTTLGQGGATFLLDRQWNKFPSPLRLELGCFLEASGGSASELLRDFQCVAKEVCIAVELVMPQVIQQQRAFIRARARRTRVVVDDPLRTALLQCNLESIPEAIIRDPFNPEHDQFYARLASSVEEKSDEKKPNHSQKATPSKMDDMES